jgi:hypothetical protein
MMRRRGVTVATWPGLAVVASGAIGLGIHGLMALPLEQVGWRVGAVIALLLGTAGLTLAVLAPRIRTTARGIPRSGVDAC